MNAADRRRATPWLAGAVIVLAALLIALWLGLGRAVHWQAAESARTPRGVAATPAPNVPPLEHFAAVWQQPLFSPTRKPEAIAAGDAGASGDLQLTGVVLSPGLHMAIVHDRLRHRDYRLIEGQASRAGPSLVTLHPRSAVIDANGTRLDLHLLPGPAPGVTSARTPAPAAVDDEAGDSAASVVPGATGTPALRAAARARRLRARVNAARRPAVPHGSGG